MKKAFTLIEMLVVIAIIVVLMSSMVGAYSHLSASAQKTKCKELVSNTATALTQLFQREGSWPKALRTKGGSDGELDEKAAYPLAKGGYMSLTSDGSKLTGYDKFGIVTPWAQAVVRRRGSSASLGDPVPGGGKVRDHILHYALDLDGDGIVDGASVGGQTISVRASAIVWACGRDGKIEAYSTGLKKDDVYSWAYGQTQNVK